MKSLSSRFKKKVADGYGWAHKNKLKAFAILAVTGATAGYTASYIENRISEGPARGAQWSTVQTDIDQLAAAKKNLDALNGVKGILTDSPGVLTTKFDAAQLDKDINTAWNNFQQTEDKTTADFAFANSLTLDDMESIRAGMKEKIGEFDAGFHNAPANRTIRSCQNYVASMPGFSRSSADLKELQNCVANGESTEGIKSTVLAMSLLLFGCFGVAGARAWHKEEEREKELRAAQDAEVAKAAPPEPLILSAPTRISAPLKLNLKPKQV